MNDKLIYKLKHHISINFEGFRSGYVDAKNIKITRNNSHYSI
jgi:hypothetical protein